MKITCRIDVAEAIRRGQNASDKMDVEIDVTQLSFKERDALSNHLMAQNFKHPVTHVWPAIPEPTAKGLRETLEKMVAGHRERSFRLCDVTHGALDSTGQKSEVKVGRFIVTENEPSAPFPAGNYCAWRVERIDNDTVYAVLDLDVSDRLSRDLSGFLRAFLNQQPHEPQNS